MPENDQDAAEVIESYRRRRERMVPILLVGLAVVLVVVGIFLIVIWVTGQHTNTRMAKILHYGTRGYLIVHCGTIWGHE